MRAHGIPAHISYTAGTYVCNCIMYNALYLAAKKYLGVRAGFIHVPFENGQVVDKANGTPFMSLEMIAKGLEYGIEAAVTTTDDVQKQWERPINVLRIKGACSNVLEHA